MDHSRIRKQKYLNKNIKLFHHRALLDCRPPVLREPKERIDDNVRMNVNKERDVDLEEIGEKILTKYTTKWAFGNSPESQ